MRPLPHAGQGSLPEENGMQRFMALVLITFIITPSLAMGADTAEKSAISTVPMPRHKMQMDEPMVTGMMKKGQMKGDVRAAADQKARKLMPMVRQEEKSMPPSKQAVSR